ARREVVYPLLIFSLFYIIDLSLLFIMRKMSNHRLLDWIVILPPFFGLIFWFVSAPNPRFANALFWLLAMSSSLILVTFLQRVFNKQFFVSTFIVVFTLANLVTF